MKCNRIRELILTDYMDNQIDKENKASVDQHLAYCPGCKEFYTDAKKVAPSLFTDMDKVRAPEIVWRRIKESIAVEKQKKIGFVNAFSEKIKYAFYIPNPAIALATILTLAVIFGTVTKLMIDRQEALKANLQEQVEYFDYSIEAPADLPANEEAGFGTSIEKYFL